MATTKKKGTGTKKKVKATTGKQAKKRASNIGLYVAVFFTLLIVVGIGYVAQNANLRAKVLGWINHEKPETEEHRIYGIDISRYQTKINWWKLRFNFDAEKDTICYKETGEHLPVSFIFLKATQGRTFDKTYNDKRKKAKKMGYKTGAYHILVSDTNIVAQARNFINIAALDSSDYPPILDIESKLVERPYSQYREKVMTWLKLVEKETGGRPLIYCSDKTREEVLNTPEFNNYHFWIARYDTIPPKSSDEWLFWQFTDKGRMVGIEGNVDISIWRGTKKELEDWRKSCWQKDSTIRIEIEKEIEIDSVNL